MKLLATTIMSLSLLALVPAYADQTKASPGDGAQTVEITRNGSQLSSKGSAEYFTGSVRIDPLFKVHDPSRTSGPLAIEAMIARGAVSLTSTTAKRG